MYCHYGTRPEQLSICALLLHFKYIKLHIIRHLVCSQLLTLLSQKKTLKLPSASEHFFKTNPLSFAITQFLPMKAYANKTRMHVQKCIIFSLAFSCILLLNLCFPEQTPYLYMFSLYMLHDGMRPHFLVIVIEPNLQFLAQICPLSVVGIIVVNFITFSSSSPEQLGRFQPNFAQRIT